MKAFVDNKKFAALALGLLLLFLPISARAEVKLSAFADPAVVKAGDTVEVTVTVSGKNMSVAEGVFTYDPLVLTYVKSTGGASDGFLSMVSAQKGGADTLTSRITFLAAGAGSAEIQFSVEKVLGYDGKEQGSAQSSVSFTVAAPLPTPAPTPLDYAAGGVLARNVKGAGESMYIWRSLENVTLPSRYTENTLEYHGKTVAAAEVANSDAPVLLYLSNAAGDKGGYYIFNAETDTLYPYETVTSVSKSYILLEPDGSVELPDGFTETTLTINGKDNIAWKARDAQGDIYLLYARNPDGEVGYFVYDPEDGSLQRFAVMPARPVKPELPSETAPAPAYTPPPSPPVPSVHDPQAESNISINGVLFYSLCGAAALMFILIAGFIVIRLADDARCRRRAAKRKAERERMKNMEIGQ